MKQIFETMLIIIVLLFSLLTNTTMITANLEISEARSFHANAIEEIQASNFDEKVISKKILEARDGGNGDWTLEVKPVTVYADRADMKVTLKYKISPLPFVKDNTYRTIVGYAR